MSAEPASAPPRACAACGRAMPATLLACPSCGGLAHADTLKALAAEAATAPPDRALAAWRQALELLPVGSLQYQRVAETIARLVPQTAPEPPAKKSGGLKWLGVAGALGLLLLKFKWVLLFLLGKGKLLLLGLAQAKTFFSMAIALGAYATLYGWRFGLGLIASLYVHEMGHVAALRRFGIAASAPMFIPGLGAFVRLNQRPASAAEDARIGLAGPIWGAAAALVCLGLGLLYQLPLLVAIGRAGAWINLFNLVPVWQLDGGRAFSALTGRQRGWAAAAAWLPALAGVDGVFFLLAIAATARAVGPNAPAKGDRPMLATYIGLVVVLAAIIALAPMPPAATGAAP